MRPPLPDGRKLMGWAVVPVLDRPDLPPHGYTARNPRWVEGGDSNKWFHGVKRSEALFNRWNASRGRKTTIFICEGPGCVMRLHEAGYPHAVATLGPSMSDRQYGQFLSLLFGGEAVYIAADNDDTGREFAERVRKKVWGVCEPELAVLFPPAGFKDMGDMQAGELAAWLQRTVGISPAA